MSDWKNLEDKLSELLKEDGAIRTPGSGNTKGEEDVIGFSIIGQCKYTDTINMSILNKDLERLLDAAHVNGKFPLFVTANKDNMVLSIPDNERLQDIVDFIIFLSTHDKLMDMISDCKSVSNYDSLSEYVGQNLKSKLNKIKSLIKTLDDKRNARLKTKFDELTMNSFLTGLD